MNTKTKATIEDLYHLPENGKAELVDGELLIMSPTGYLPGFAGGEIFVRLREYARRTKSGIATPDNVGYSVELPHRGSFNPDAAFYMGKPGGMKFLEGAPVFAAEVRSEGDYGPQAEDAIAKIRHDSFEAGTLVVWDVDLQSEVVVKAYRADAPLHPVSYHRGDIADAEPAIHGWSMPVNDLFG